MAWTEGDRITHARWGGTGTVRVDTDGDGQEFAVVDWDGTSVTDEVALIADQLRAI